MMLSLIVESAVRSLSLALVVLLALTIFRVRSLHMQSLAWTTVLFSSLAMPLLMSATDFALTSAPAAQPSWTPPSLFLKPMAPASAERPVASLNWVRPATAAYFAVAAALLLRMTIGLLRSLRVRRFAMRLSETWTGDQDVRISETLRCPATVGRTILFPAGWREWNLFERTSVFAHEQSHVRRGDFYVQLFAGLHRVVFWFNPLAWWLERRLIVCAEAICDDAALAQVDNRTAYAEVLVRLASVAAVDRFYGLAMARRNTIVQRIERILRETDFSPRVSSIRRVVTIALLLPVVALATGTWLVEAKTQAPITTFILERASRRVPVARPQEQRTTRQEAPANTQLQQRSAEGTQYLRRWPSQEVPDIITDEERAAFDRLNTDEQREQFIENFWARRDPSPGTIDNEFRNEYYRRIFITNQLFAAKAGKPGWQTDRGRILIKFGEPDDIEKIPGAQPPFERWRYRYIEGIGTNITLKFVDRDGSGDYALESNPESPNVLQAPGRR
jgi:GWxTD domain-containing protein